MRNSGPGVVPWLEARACAYDVLKCVFLHEPPRPFMGLLIEGDVLRAFSAGRGNGAIAQAVRSIRGYMDQPDLLSQEAWERLRWDYTRLFIGPGRPLAPPWESVYRNDERLHFSAETLEVRAAYRRHGLAIEGVGHEPDDHIGLELAFLHALCEAAMERAERADRPGLAAILEDQRVFLSGHLLKWVPDWTLDVVKSARTGFYRGMAELLNAYVALDRRNVEDALGVLRQGSLGRPATITAGD
jgi:putative dimethyl sulfoxide reductase chaperone